MITMVTVTQAANVLGIDPSTARRWAEEARRRGDPGVVETVRGYVAPIEWWQQQAAAKKPRRPRKGNRAPA